MINRRNYIQYVFYLIVFAFLSPAMAGSYDDFITAVKRDHRHTVEALLQRGFDPNTVDESGQPGIIAALLIESYEVAGALAASDRLQLEATNSSGETALMMASLRGQSALVQRLLQRGAAVNRPGWSPLHYAATAPDEAPMKLLLARGATVASRGPFIEARIDGAWAPGGLFTGETTLDVAVHAASWVPVDRVVLYENGRRADVRTCEGNAPEPCRTQFALAPQSDAVYVVVAESDREMRGPGAGTTAWATTSAVRVDTAGDGWTAPLPPLVLRSR
jgi:ankyrin repeat protein